MARVQNTTRVSLPLYGVKDAGTLVKDGLTFSDWTLQDSTSGNVYEGSTFTGTGSTLTQDSDGSALLTVPAGESAGIYASIADTQFVASDFISYNLWCSDNSDSNTIVEINLDNDAAAGFATYNRTINTNANRLLDGWLAVGFLASDFANVPSGGWGQPMRMVRLVINNVSSSIPVSAKLGNLYRNLRTNSKIIFSFDDGNDSDKAAADDMKALGMYGTFYIVSGFIDTATYLTMAEAQSMYADGHDICNQTDNHLELAPRTPSQQVTSIQNCKDWIIANVGRGGENLLAYPGGSNDATVRVSAASVGVTHAGTVKGFRQFHGIDGAFSPLEMYRLQVLATATTLTTSMNDLIARGGGTIEFLFHRTDGTAGTANITNANWKIFLAEVHEYQMRGLVDVVTKSEWIKSMGNHPRIQTA